MNNLNKYGARMNKKHYIVDTYDGWIAYVGGMNNLFVGAAYINYDLLDDFASYNNYRKVYPFKKDHKS